MILHVVERARRATYVDRVVVATDDERIERVVLEAGHEAVLTGEHASGTDRAAEVAQSFKDAELIVNVQGDEPLLDPVDLDALIADTRERPEAMHTMARYLGADADDPSVVKVECGPNRRALRFSRAPMPDARGQVFQHVGLYSFSPEKLIHFASLPSTDAERAEHLEQLRALEHGIPIYVTMCASSEPRPAVDVPEDIAKVEAILAASQGNTPLR